MARLLERYQQEIVPKLMEKLGTPNRLALPKLVKIVVNSGLGAAVENKKILEEATKDLAQITGQRPVLTKARKSVAGFKVRDGLEIGAKVTLRGKRMYEFLDRLISIVIPRIRDFRGVSPNSFDGHGNYSLGIGEQIVFPEIDVDNVETIIGMDITLVMSGGSDEGSFELLREFGMPFRS